MSAGPIGDLEADVHAGLQGSGHRRRLCESQVHDHSSHLTVVNRARRGSATLGRSVATASVRSCGLCQKLRVPGRRHAGTAAIVDHAAPGRKCEHRYGSSENPPQRLSAAADSSPPTPLPLRTDATVPYCNRSVCRITYVPRVMCEVPGVVRAAALFYPRALGAQAGETGDAAMGHGVM